VAVYAKDVAGAGDFARCAMKLDFHAIRCVGSGTQCALLSLKSDASLSRIATPKLVARGVSGDRRRDTSERRGGTEDTLGDLLSGPHNVSYCAAATCGMRCRGRVRVDH
jgi:hypothetical protein